MATPNAGEDDPRWESKRTDRSASGFCRNRRSDTVSRKSNDWANSGAPQTAARSKRWPTGDGKARHEASAWFATLLKRWLHRCPTLRQLRLSHPQSQLSKRVRAHLLIANVLRLQALQVGGSRSATGPHGIGTAHRTAARIGTGKALLPAGGVGHDLQPTDAGIAMGGMSPHGDTVIARRASAGATGVGRLL